jgi:O-antigen ligase
VLVFCAVQGRNRWWGWPLAVAMFIAVAGGESRASLVGSIAAIGWLLLGRRWAYPVVQAGSLAAVLAVVAALAHSGESPWAERKLEGASERLASIVDVSGTRNYESEDSFSKGDNNRFRLVWWRTVVTETWEQGRVFGLGFGYDLAKSFIQTYDPAMGEDFFARSPHSIVIGTFGRMGILGLGAFALLVGALTAKTWRALMNRSTAPRACGLWGACWVILVSSCFGVVLEGPMGAVVFWTLLGLANGMTADAPVSGAIPRAKSPVPKGTSAATDTLEPRSLP